MSTTPTVPMETIAATEELLDVESIKALLDGFDPAALLPDLSKVFDSLVPLCRIAVLAGPVVLLLLLSAIQKNIPVPLFEIDHLTPGITVFALSFLSLSSSLQSPSHSSSSQINPSKTLNSSPFLLGDSSFLCNLEKGNIFF